MRSQEANGMSWVGYVRMSAQYVLLRFSFAMTWARGRNSRVGGTR